MTNTQLAGVTLPQVSSYSVNSQYVGGVVTLANGAIRRDLMVSGAKRRFSLAWVALTDAQLATVRTQYALAVAGDVAFVGPDGASCNVNAGSSPAINAVLDQVWELVAACGGWFYCDADGKLHYHNLTAITPAALAQHYGAQATLALDESNVAGVTIARPTRELYSDVTVETAFTFR